MSSQYTPKVIAAEKVQDGKLVYLTSCDAWTPDIEIAEYLQEEDLEWRLAFARRLREVKNAALATAPKSYLPQASVA